ncbi:Spherulation-specific family 4 [Xylariaceae sp. FL1019]|nr:Spherulation-specific family 4 [Xylariaceae sp. FL1019]
MKSTLPLITSLAASASATGVLLPLYIYPSDTIWAPVYNAVSADSSLDWLVVVNPDSGPGATGQPGNNDASYIAGTSKLNGYSNVKTVGYVRTNYGQQDVNTLHTELTEWANWASYTASDIAVHGIFFDEAPTDNFDYMNDAITFARNAFADAITTICNFGTEADVEFYGICDVVVAAEYSGSQYGDGSSTISGNIPSGYAAQAAIIVHDFTADASTLASDLSAIQSAGVGWTYFTSSSDYTSITVTPATVEAVAADL